VDSTQGVIRKVGNKYCIFSKKGKRLSCHPSRKAAQKRLRQIEFFKHNKGSIADVIAFVKTFGRDFEPEGFTRRSMNEWVRLATKYGAGPDSGV
jgi:hypothetical protein